MRVVFRDVDFRDPIKSRHYTFSEQKLVMKIAVDARALSSPIVGIGRYTESLLLEMIPKGGQWFLYSDMPLLRDYSVLGDVTVRVPNRPVRLAPLWCQFGFTRWAQRDDIDVFWSPRHHLPLLLPLRVRKIVTIHDLVWLRFPRTMKPLGWLFEFLFMPPSLYLADQIISVSQFTANELGQVFKLSPSRISAIPNAAFPGGQNGAVTALGPADVDDEYFLFVGTPEPRKNLLRLLQAFKRLDRTGIRLFVVGSDGWGNQNVGQMAMQLGIAESVVLFGRRDDADLAYLYEHALALVMPSLYEGFGLPLLEAMSHGVPVITSDCASMPEVAGEGGLLVDPYSIDEIATAMGRLLDDKALRARLSDKSREQAEKFSWQLAGESTLSVISDQLPDL